MPRPITATIDLAALAHNLGVARTHAPHAKVFAVIKANAYGHGLVPVARILADADGFAVARLEEALQLREAGIGTRIVVLGGFVTGEEAHLASQHRLDLVVHSIAQLATLESMPGLHPVDLWIKVDTGMGRLGLEPEALGEVRERLAHWQAGRGAMRLMTHLASADEPGNPATGAQLDQFARLRRDWRGDVSLANSAGVLQWPQSWSANGAPDSTNWIRPGLMLYGVSPVAGRPSASLGLRPVMSFETRLMAVRRLARGRRVGYGGDWEARRDSVVGVAAAGYADGYPWHRADGTAVLVNGARAPVIGRVSMDMISIDLTDAPAAQPGDRVVLWGDGLPVEEVAVHAGTISYELLSGMSPRVVRQVED